MHLWNHIADFAETFLKQVHWCLTLVFKNDHVKKKRGQVRKVCTEVKKVIMKKDGIDKLYTCWSQGCINK